MNYKIIFLIVGVFALLLVGFFFYQLYVTHPKLESFKPLFQGPVPQGYDLNYFRNNGKTIPLTSEVKN